MYGAWEEMLSHCLARHKGITTNTPKSKVLGDLLGRLSFILVQFNARAEEPFLIGQASTSNYTQHALGSSFVHVCFMLVMGMIISLHYAHIWDQRDLAHAR